jgi:hypothetical protein
LDPHSRRLSQNLSAISTIAGILTRTDARFDRQDLQINTYLWSIETRDHTG